MKLHSKAVKTKAFMNKKSICFICWGKTAELLVNRDGSLCEYFAEVFDDLILLDVSNVFTTALVHGRSSRGSLDRLPSKFRIVSPGSFSECKNFLKSQPMIVIHYFSQRWYDWWLYYYLRKYSIPLIYAQTLSIILSFKPRDLQRQSLSVIASRKLNTIVDRIFRALVLCGFFSKVDTYFLSNKAKAEAKKNDRRFNEIVLTNSSFYDSMLFNSYRVLNDYVVFVDSIVPYATDQIHHGYKPTDREPYFKNLNRVLSVIESTLGKEVVICLHPSYDEDNISRDFGRRKAVKYRTDEFIAKAELVLFHDSSAVNSAVVYGKKVVQLTGSQFNDFVRNNCEVFQQVFSFTTIDIYEATDDQIREAARSPRLDGEKYETFLSNFVVASGQKGLSSCEQIAEHISHKYGIERRK